VEACRASMNRLMSPDPDSRTACHEGRRIEKTDGGWIILNYAKFRARRDVSDEPETAAARERMRKMRERNKAEQERNKAVTSASVSASASASVLSPDGEPTTAATSEPPIEAQAAEVYAAYPLKVGKPAALRAIRAAIGRHGFDFVKLRTVAFAAARGADKEFLAHPSTWFNQERYNDDPSTWIRSAAPPKPSRNDGTFNAGKENDYANAYYQPTPK